MVNKEGGERQAEKVGEWWNTLIPFYRNSFRAAELHDTPSRSFLELPFRVETWKCSKIEVPLSIKYREAATFQRERTDTTRSPLIRAEPSNYGNTELSFRNCLAPRRAPVFGPVKVVPFLLRFFRIARKVAPVLRLRNSVPRHLTAPLHFPTMDQLTRIRLNGPPPFPPLIQPNVFIGVLIAAAKNADKARGRDGRSKGEQSGRQKPSDFILLLS